ncbi:MAG TPA: class I SAM-dependent methyltransferase [Anaerolineales bacterium]
MNFLRRLFFNLWYFRDPPWDTGITPPELVDFIEHHPPGRALDLGCGTGTNVITLAQNGWDVTGVDFVARAIRAARRKARQAGVDVDLRVGDVTRLDALHGPYDLILDIGCFHSLSQAGKRDYIENLTRLMAPGGIYLMYGFFKDSTDSGTGLVEADIDRLITRFQLLDRQDGTERGTRPSAWFTFQKTISTMPAREA